MVIRFLGALIKQLVCVVLLSLAPLGSFLLLGKVNLLVATVRGDYVVFFQELIELSLQQILTTVGSVLLMWSIIYHPLPVGFLPIRVPFIGAGDRFIAKLGGCIGILALYSATIK